jgi:hypothetical protein
MYIGRANWLVLSFAFFAITAAQLNYTNPISQPQPGEVVTSGSTYYIVWTPTKGNTISIEIWNTFSLASYFNGSNCVVDGENPDCSQIAANIPNTGNFEWHVPSNVPDSDTYWLDIFIPDPDIAAPSYYLTANFSINKASLVPGPTGSTNFS